MTSVSKSVVILGTGSYAPEKVVTNDDMAQIVETSDEWIRTRSGIRQRHFAADGEATSDLATQAAQKALDAAQVTAEEIDLILVATMTPDMPSPSTACLVQSKLGLPTITALDIQAACSGFVYAMNLASAMLKSGQSKKALVIGAETMSSILDFEDRTTCVLFGDGAGAVVLGTSDEPDVGVLGSLCGADGSNPELLYVPGGGSALPASAETVNDHKHFLKMNGKEIFKLAVRVMCSASTDILERFGHSSEELALVIPHQANLRIIDSLMKRLKLSPDQFHNNLDRFGNTSAASIPIALDEAFRLGRIKQGDLVLLVAFGAGLTWGSTLIKWQ
ncbi:beta-ketoacyl-ACP synthase III [Coraliomargarita akajimensis]|uniref:Beta-ketoacyl-[acyl-carrier-protein] synthase III n=1 Tax=Coraliomargarita akajimensis (strain DSM 45221 / IAM 15411 / JCM 23193 / KCTC 12865 / 04OKA010-24) TaxID=583355 RepID=D5ERB8_CORAD|nr:beta-ketoacyl-ACP synthase III [Coraliomargarita akajimensis]ADE55962.1 3-oxoacyl-(acyl-carrier-protein) synthase III [Coraliomargarita akajimensis DSM 45221]